MLSTVFRTGNTNMINSALACFVLNVYFLGETDKLVISVAWAVLLVCLGVRVGGEWCRVL